MLMFTKITTFLFLCILSVTSWFAAGEKLEIGTIEREPFSYKVNDEWTGFSIDLWKEIAKRNQLDYSFTEFSDFSKLLGAVEKEKVDLSIANISITLDREKKMDFSQPIFDSGLNILTLIWIPEFVFLSPVIIDNLLNIFIWIGIFILCIVHFFFIYNVIQWNISPLSYFTEIFLIFFEVLRQLKDGYGFKILMLTLVWWSIVMVSYFSQRVAVTFADYESNVADANISEYSDISFTDLEKIKVWVTKGSTSMKYLERKKIEYKVYKNMSSMISDLQSWNIDALVHDDPLLRYFTENEGKERFSVMRKLFHPEKFGIAYPEQSELREQFDRSILSIWEDGTYDILYKKYFWIY